MARRITYTHTQTDMISGAIHITYCHIIITVIIVSTKLSHGNNILVKRVSEIDSY